MGKLIDADELLNRLPDDLPYKASVRRVLMQAPEVAPVREEDSIKCQSTDFAHTAEHR